MTQSRALRAGRFGALDADAYFRDRTLGYHGYCDMEELEKGMTRRHTFFCVNKDRHTANENVVEATPKRITIFSEEVEGWLITTEEPVIDKVIPLREALQGGIVTNDPE